MAETPNLHDTVHVVLPDGTHRPALVIGIQVGSFGSRLLRTYLYTSRGQLHHDPANFSDGAVPTDWLAEDSSGTTPSTWHWPEPEQPAVGRIVRYVSSEPNTRPAIGTITDVRSAHARITVLTPLGEWTSDWLPHDPSGTPGTWHYR